MQSVGLIGVGLLGSAIADRYIQAQVAVLAYDVNPRNLHALSELGGQIADSSASVFQQCSRVIFSLPNSDIVREVVVASRVHLRPGGVILDTTTGDPLSTESLAMDLANIGVTYLDTTVVGSSEQLRRGEATLLVGGAEDSILLIRPLLEILASKIFFIGPVGSAAKMKLVVNLAIGLHRAVLAESLALANALGLDLEKALEAMIGSPAYSTMMETKGQKMLRGDFTPQARLAQHRKDVQLMLQSAHKAGVNLPLSTTHFGLLNDLIAAGYGDLDNSSIIRAYLQAR